jgi:hypothetical protein
MALGWGESRPMCENESGQHYVKIIATFLKGVMNADLK